MKKSIFALAMLLAMSGEAQEVVSVNIVACVRQGSINNDNQLVLSLPEDHVWNRFFAQEGSSWIKISGPGNVVFSSPGTAITDMSLDAPGVYKLGIKNSENREYNVMTLLAIQEKNKVPTPVWNIRVQNLKGIKK